METLLAIAIGVVFTASVYLFLARDLTRMLLGFILFGTATNLLLLLAGRLGMLTPAVIPADADTLSGAAANPLPQALILTAIVIGFGLTAFGLMLALQTWRRHGTLDAESLNEAERLDAPTLSEPEAEATAPSGLPADRRSTHTNGTPCKISS